MFNDFEINLTGVFAIVTIILWLFWFVVGLITIYQSKLFKPLSKAFDSLTILLKPRKQRYYYNNLYIAGYIYKWSYELCLKKWDRGL